jgi:hypothetical protein
MHKNAIRVDLIWFLLEAPFYVLLAGPPGAARDYFTISLWKSPVQIDLRTLGALVSPSKIYFLYTNPPRGATFVCWIPPNSQSMHHHLLGWTLRAPGLGEPPTNKILHGKPTPRSNFCLLVPAKLFKLIPPFGGWTLWAQGWGEPPKIKFYYANPPRVTTFVCCPTPNYLS